MQEGPKTLAHFYDQKLLGHQDEMKDLVKLIEAHEKKMLDKFQWKTDSVLFKKIKSLQVNFRQYTSKIMQGFYDQTNKFATQKSLNDQEREQIEAIDRATQDKLILMSKGFKALEQRAQMLIDYQGIDDKEKAEILSSEFEKNGLFKFLEYSQQNMKLFQSEKALMQQHTAMVDKLGNDYDDLFYIDDMDDFQNEIDKINKNIAEYAPAPLPNNLNAEFKQISLNHAQNNKPELAKVTQAISQALNEMVSENSEAIKKIQKKKTQTPNEMATLSELFKGKANLEKLRHAILRHHRYLTQPAMNHFSDKEKANRLEKFAFQLFYCNKMEKQIEEQIKDNKFYLNLAQRKRQEFEKSFFENQSISEAQRAKLLDDAVKDIEGLKGFGINVPSFDDFINKQMKDLNTPSKKDESTGMSFLNILGGLSNIMTGKDKEGGFKSLLGGLFKMLFKMIGGIFSMFMEKSEVDALNKQFDPIIDQMTGQSPSVDDADKSAKDQKKSPVRTRRQKTSVVDGQSKKSGNVTSRTCSSISEVHNLKSNRLKRGN